MLLSDEEIVKEASKDSTYCQLSVDIGHWASKAQLKKVYEWGEELCPHYALGHREDGTFEYSTKQKHECCTCWQELKKEIE